MLIGGSVPRGTLVVHSYHNENIKTNYPLNPMESPQLWRRMPSATAHLANISHSWLTNHNRQYSRLGFWYSYRCCGMEVKSKGLEGWQLARSDEQGEASGRAHEAGGYG